MCVLLFSLRTPIDSRSSSSILSIAITVTIAASVVEQNPKP